MSLIKFPTQIKPSRVTVQLMRVDETIASPLTNIQQVVSRGNPAWKWTYEYTNLSESEREIVEAFLLKCKGSLNTFKVTDPADYSLRGSISEWTDAFSGYGSFNTQAGSDYANIKINSWFCHGTLQKSHITDEQTVRVEWVSRGATQRNLAWIGDSVNSGTVYPLVPGAAYVQRLKYFPGPDPQRVLLVAGSGTDYYMLGQGPASEVYSATTISNPFVASINSHRVTTFDSPTTGGKVGTFYEFADYRLTRCALLVRSENLFTYSNSFGASDWTKSALDAVHNTAADPLGGNHTWRATVDPGDGSGPHYLAFGAITKSNTTDMFTIGIYARVGNGLNCVRLRLEDGTNDAWADIDVSVASVYDVSSSAVFKQVHGKIFDVGSSYYRLQLTAFCSSHSTLNAAIYLVNSQGGGTSYTVADTSYIELVGATCAKFPLLKPYFETTTTEMIGSGSVTGSSIMLSGFDGDERIKAGQRFELITQYYNVNSDYYEMSEYKRITREAIARLDGTAEIEFDPPIRNNPKFQMMHGNQGGRQTLHNAVVFHNPEMKARLLGSTTQYIEKPLRMTDIVFDVLEDLTE